jgi:hypothetical protein
MIEILLKLFGLDKHIPLKKVFEICYQTCDGYTLGDDLLEVYPSYPKICEYFYASMVSHHIPIYALEYPSKKPRRIPEKRLLNSRLSGINDATVKTSDLMAYKKYLKKIMEYSVYGLELENKNLARLLQKRHEKITDDLNSARNNNEHE